MEPRKMIPSSRETFSIAYPKVDWNRSNNIVIRSIRFGSLLKEKMN